ncbi:MAG: hypothetical protein WD711_12195 [Dongiaceae bacterium]
MAGLDEKGTKTEGNPLPPFAVRKAKGDSIEKPLRGVSFRILGMIFCTFVLGVCAALVVENWLGSERIKISTLEIVGFVFSVALGGASMVLAVLAISLGRASETAMLTRSDASIALQNEVYLQTVNALQRIESSTGVTERRIEDIISGRAGDISHRLVQLLNSPKAALNLSGGSLERRIEESIIEQLSDVQPSSRGSSTTEGGQKRRMRSTRETSQLNDEHEYTKFKNAVLASASNIDGVTVEKFGDGRINASGDDLFDGVFQVKGKRIGVSTFSQDWIPNLPILVEGLKLYVARIANEVQEKNFSQAIILADSEKDDDRAILQLFESAKNILEPSIAARIVILGGKRDELVVNLREVVNKSIEASA